MLHGGGTSLVGLLLAVSLPLATLAAATPAKQGDRFDGTPGVSSPGDSLEIHFTNPDLANKTIKVLLFDDHNKEIVVEIPLDKTGKGEKTIPTPKWNVVILTHPTSDAHGIVILD